MTVALGVINTNLDALVTFHGESSLPWGVFSIYLARFSWTLRAVPTLRAYVPIHPG